MDATDDRAIFTLSAAELDAFARVYREADENAWALVKKMKLANGTRAAHLVAIRANLKAAVLEELAELGCPPNRLDGMADAIIRRAALKPKLLR